MGNVPYPFGIGPQSCTSSGRHPAPKSPVSGTAWDGGDVTTDYGEALKAVYASCLPLRGLGDVPDYIPELAGIDDRQFGLALCTTDGELFAEGDSETGFSVQSIVKVFTLALGIPHIDAFRGRIQVEPSGDPFNSLVQLEYEEGIPRNPFINAGALVVTDVLMDVYDDPKQSLLDYVRELCGSEAVTYDESVAASELRTASRNRSLAYLMKSFGNIKHDVEELLDVYCHHCALEMNLQQLVRAFTLFARSGVPLGRTEPLLQEEECRRALALMMTCGFYDESGDFAFRVGLPGKSGVGGGIVTVSPGRFALASWSPGLNEKGNSELGMRALERFVRRTGESVFQAQ